MKELIEIYTKRYEGIEIEQASIEDLVYILCSYILNTTVMDLKLKRESVSVDLEILDKYMKQVVEENMPVQYILGKVYLYNEEYIVNSSVLIPRQDTEVLIEETIKVIDKENKSSLLDLCTGTGAVGISISKNSNIQNCTLVDISKEALDITTQNIELNSATNCSVIQSDMFQNLKEVVVDIIVSNPPYITKKDMEELSLNVKKEPALALFGGEDGLDFYKIIFKEGKKHLKNSGYILVEIGYDQAESVKDIIKKEGSYDNIEVIQDLNGKDRVVKCRFHKI